MRKAISILCLGFGALILSGCASAEKDDLSERPWNTQKSWETGLPPGMMNPRY